jgi:hypothetical protein
MLAYPGYWKGYYFEYDSEADQDLTLNLVFNKFDLR